MTILQVILDKSWEVDSLVREGLIPTLLGAAVTTTGVTLRQRNVNPAISWSIAAFGAAHVLLGAIDLVEHRR